VAIRVARPYATEEELLERELETLTRTSVTLLGAHFRPQGVVLRFELVLSSGQVLMRGEGRVVGYKPDAHDGLGGLTLRFTRLDSRTKAVVDRAAALRDRRRPSAAAPANIDAASDPAPIPSLVPSVLPSLLPSLVPSPSPSLVPSLGPSLAPSLVPSFTPSGAPVAHAAPPPSLADMLEPPSRPLVEGSADDLERERSGMLPLDPLPAAADSELRLPSPSPSAPSVAKAEARPPGDRDALLERLRARSKSLGQNALDELLGRRR
jgi:hypothetical protein